MKKNSKKKLREMSNAELYKRYKYLKSKLPPNTHGISNEMKWMKFHMRKHGMKVPA